ncbi:DUF3999 family protein [Mucilaginibacter sp.]|uniref:DUF3999 family protein n=1 Tax=Mucilaginibacter sp. TaxID=1882438 RepID=UPI0028470AC3|nr:DUF3999 family protein [Mucilaginibacter sp.]MDR3695665.1 DUF3999 family protein [Mucilaginibacter sp.]
MRRSQKIKAGIFFTGLFLALFSASAQNTFKYAAAIPKTDSAGFYKISLQPAFVAKSNPDFSDIRLIDQKGHFVPYITADNLPQPANEKFVVFPRLAVASKTDTGTSYIIENTASLPVSMLWVKLRNTAVKRTVNLSGSDDLKRWFAIEEDVPLQQAGLNSGGAYSQSLSFPASNYRYLKLLVNDKNKTPLKFMEAGIYTEQSVSKSYFPVPGVRVSQQDSNNVTYIRIRLNDKYLINRINLEITAPKYYKRDIAVYQIDGQQRSLVSNAEIYSGKSNSLLFAAKADELELQIDNGDNLPLIIKNVEVFQADQFIVTYLDAGQSYQLLTGDKKATAPDYDLKFFIDSIHQRIPEISPVAVVKNTAYQLHLPVVKKDNSMILWLSIIAALLLLSLLTWKMVTEVNDKTGKA